MPSHEEEVDDDDNNEEAEQEGPRTSPNEPGPRYRWAWVDRAAASAAAVAVCGTLIAFIFFGQSSSNDVGAPTVTVTATATATVTAEPPATATVTVEASQGDPGSDRQRLFLEDFHRPSTAWTDGVVEGAAGSNGLGVSVTLLDGEEEKLELRDVGDYTVLELNARQAVSSSATDCYASIRVVSAENLLAMAELSFGQEATITADISDMPSIEIRVAVSECAGGGADIVLTDISVS